MLADAASGALVAEQEAKFKSESEGEEIHGLEEWAQEPEQVNIDLSTWERSERPSTRVDTAAEVVKQEGVAEEYEAGLKEVAMIPGIVSPEYEPSAVERYR